MSGSDEGFDLERISKAFSRIVAGVVLGLVFGGIETGLVALAGAATGWVGWLVHAVNGLYLGVVLFLIAGGLVRGRHRLVHAVTLAVLAALAAAAWLTRGSA